MAIVIKTEADAALGNYGFDRSYVYLIGGIAALGGVLFGFDLVIISGTVSFFKNVFQLNGFQTGWAVGCINLGAAIGALIGGKLSNSLGRKKLLMLCAVLICTHGCRDRVGNHFSDVYLFQNVEWRGSRGGGFGLSYVCCRDFACFNARQNGFFLPIIYCYRYSIGVFIQLFVVRKW